ncbi:MAG: CPBP family intramembrane metalloprotease, partial [Planctomycetales bacterium]|nr:CPBP family intramembrane metalloprotease [Planctomycetales bacterium]
FRGALQPLVARWWGTPAAVAAVSLVFGAVHAATVAYFLLATVFGLYLGALAAATGDLTAVILIHALYDWAALAWLDRSKDEPPRTAPPDQAETDAP